MSDRSSCSSCASPAQTCRRKASRSAPDDRAPIAAAYRPDSSVGDPFPLVTAGSYAAFDRSFGASGRDPSRQQRVREAENHRPDEQSDDPEGDQTTDDAGKDEQQRQVSAAFDEN